MRCCGGVETSIMVVDHDASPSSVARLCAPVRARSLSICHAMHVLCGHVRQLTAAPVSVRFGRRSERLRRRTDTEETYAAGRGGCGLSASSRRTSRSCTHPVRRRAPGAASGSRHSRSVRRPWRAQWLDGRRGIPPDHLGCQRPLRECVRPCALLAVPVRSLCTRSTHPCLCVPVWMSVRVVGWRRWQRLKLAWQARLGPICVACKFGRTIQPSRMYVAGAARPPVRGGGTGSGVHPAAGRV